MNVAALQQAIFQRLGNVSAVVSAVSGIYDSKGAPQPDDAGANAAFPYVTIDIASVTPFDTDTSDGANAVVQVHIWHRGTDYQRRLLADAIYAALHKFELVITAANTINCLFQSSVPYLDPDGITSHEVVLFRVTYDDI